MSLTNKRRGEVRRSDRTRSASWEDIFQTYTIFDGICARLEPQDLIALRRTTKQLSGLFDTLFNAQWNINRQLKRFVDDPVALRSFMSSCQALISGSFALQFFERVIWKESDLDIYVEHGLEDETALPLEKHLVGKEHYTLQPPIENLFENYPRIPAKHIYQVNTYLRPNNEEPGNNLKIQVIYTYKTPLETILQGFYTTAIVNIMSWDCAWSLFPDTTFIKRKTYQLVSLDSFYGNLIRKYSRRGWRTLEVPWHDDSQYTKSLQTDSPRRIGDSLSWKIQLNTAGVTPGCPAAVYDLSFFNMTYIKSGETNFGESRPHYQIDTTSFEACVLRYKYLRPRHISRDEDFWMTMGSRLENLTLVEVMKLPDDERPMSDDPDNLGTLFTNASRIVRQPPLGWTFWDDHVAQWFDAFQRIPKRERQILMDL